MPYAVKMGALGWLLIGQVPEGVRPGHELAVYIYREMFSLDSDQLDPDLPRGYVKLDTILDVVGRTGLVKEKLEDLTIGECLEY
jgi:hypothetical protein